MKNLIKYFSTNHLITNILFFGTLFCSIFVWTIVGKEELPEFASNWIRVSTFYPGASSEDVELFVTKPLEDELKGIVGVEEILTTSSLGSSSIRIVIDDDYPDKDDVLQNIKDAVLRVDLPSDVRNLPKIRQFRSDEKAILDVGLYLKDKKFLNTQDRLKLQKYVLSFESQILGLNEISSVSISHYLKPELQIQADPDKLLTSEISLSEILNQIRKNHIREPIGSMLDKGESRVSLYNELDSVDSISNLYLRSSYDSDVNLKLSDIASINKGFDKANSIFKINGHEAIFLNIKKNVSTDILSAQKAVMNFINNYKLNNKNSPLEIVLMDDESYAVTNRLEIVSSNAIIGFILIILVLFLFLDFKTGVWVGMGIPFSAGFTLIIAHLYGYTVNNMTLAGIIIVLGIVVDDAIIIAESIYQKKEQGMSAASAAYNGTIEVVKPIVGSILTTCVAFLPLLYFEGFFGKFVSFIPLVVILMLLGSLVESLFILPSHLSFDKKIKEKKWFDTVVHFYKKILTKAMIYRHYTIMFFIGILLCAGYLYSKEMKFTMFPREESLEVFIKVKAKEGHTRKETAAAIYQLEQDILKFKDDVVAVRSTIGMSRRGGEVKENEASILVELYPADDRKNSLNFLLDNWEQKEYKDLVSVKFLRGRWGHSSGSAIELWIQENDDNNRKEISKTLLTEMNKLDFITDVELERELVKKEYRIKLDQQKVLEYGVDPSVIINTLKTYVQGSVVYVLNKGDEEIDVKFSVTDKYKESIDSILDLRVETKNSNLAFLRNLISIQEIDSPVSIKRMNFKRTSMIYANPVKEKTKTPVEIAEYMEKNIFPQISLKYPSAVLKFSGEVEDTRESSNTFLSAIIFVLIAIFLILVILFNSFKIPLLILGIIPFGIAGTILILILHDMSTFGFFAAIGALGMIGVVVNDAIVMINRMENLSSEGEMNLEKIVVAAAERLRPVILTTVTTVVGILPTAYGVAGYDSLLAEMMLTMGWGLAFGTLITLFLVPTLYTYSTAPFKWT